MRKKVCIFCTTPYQIIAATNIVVSNDLDADLYLVNQFALAHEYGKRISERNIFTNVRVIDEDYVINYKKPKNVLSRNLLAIYHYITVDNLAKRVLIPNVKYDEMYISSKAFVPRICMLHFIKHKENIRTIYYDDGEGSYDNIFIYRPKKYDEIVRRILYGKKSVELSKEYYLYLPDLYKKLHPNTDNIIYKIEMLWDKQKIKDFFNYVFDFKDDNLIKEKVIILDTITEQWDEESVNRLHGFYQNIIDVYGKDNVIIKKHPRDDSEKKFDCHYYKASRIPFELICMNMSLEDKMFIAYRTTGVFTPKLLFNAEPKAIVLYKVFSNEVEDDALRFYNYIKEEYRNPNKFSIPKNLEELKACIKID